MLNKQKGNMYDWVTHTWNTVKGKCYHNCSYCYMKKWGEQKPVRFTPSELKTDLGSNNIIFVGSSCDMWADGIPKDWILKTLKHCNRFEQNKYLFQTKNPDRFHSFEHEIPLGSILGTTIESDIWHKAMGKSPHPDERFDAIWNLKESGFKTMITIEPVLDFNSDFFIRFINNARPDFVNIGANTNTRVELIEPNHSKLSKFIGKLSKSTKINKKSNINRLL